jgi:hypothetical protein
LTEKDIKDLYEVRIALETAILRHITPKLSKAELRKIETIYQKGKGAIKADDRPKSRFRKRNTFTGLSLRVPPKAGKGACLHAVVHDCGKQAFRHAGVAISRVPSLLSGQGFVSLAMTIP